MKKILIIIIVVISFLCIGLGIYFVLTDDKEEKFDNVYSDNSSMIYIETEEELKEKNIITTNVHIYKTLQDAIDYLKSSYTTENVVVKDTTNDRVTIVVLEGTSDEAIYEYSTLDGELLIK